MTASITVLDPRPTQTTPHQLPEVPQYSRDVATLLSLLHALPPTVSAETGAQIIRATLDTMVQASEEGLSTESVLQQAQVIQADCLSATRAYLDDIERCQERIRHLRALVDRCQTQATELADLIDVFLVSDAIPDERRA